MKLDLKAVVLDVDGTLCSLTHSVGEIYAEVLASLAIPADASKLSRAARLEWVEYQDIYLNSEGQHQTSSTREREVWLEFVRRVLTRADLAEAAGPKVVSVIYDVFATGRYRAIEPGALDFLKEAKKVGLVVAAATNNDARTKSVLRDLGLTDYLFDVFDAGDLLWKKPAVQFFTSVANRLGVEGDLILHVGNDPKLDIEPARRAGWSAVKYGAGSETSEGAVRDYSELRAMLGLA